MPDAMDIIKPRVMEIITPLGADVLLFSTMTAREELSQLFEYEINLLSTRNDISLDEILGKNVAVKLEMPFGEPRCFNGYVTRFEQAGTKGKRTCRRSSKEGVSEWLRHCLM